MSIHFAWFIPVLFIYRRGQTFRFSAFNFVLLVLVDEACRESESLPAHEIEHTKQMLMTLGLHAILYFASRRYRYWSELRAYRQSIKHGLSIDVAAALMEANYGFDKQPAAILADLRR
jgi:hypothetical protein